MSKVDRIKDVVLLDGGTGMALIQMGHPELENDPLWSAALVKTHPEDLVKLHKEFFLAGSEVVVSATYQASAAGYTSRFGVAGDEAEELVKKSVRLALEGRDQAEKITGRKLYVAASIGPYGAVLCDRSEYHGNYVDSMPRHELVAWHSARMELVVAEKPDLLAIETIPSVAEAEAILESLGKFPGMKAWLTFQCKDGCVTGHGELIQEAVQAVSGHPQIVAVGVNCVNPEFVASLVESIASLKLPHPIIAKPNSGLYDTEENQTKQKKFVGDTLESWIAQGASWIGGCCNINPPDIGDIHQRLETSESVRLVSLEGKI